MTLESFYHLSKEDIDSTVETILNTPNLLYPEAKIIVMALALYVQENMDCINTFHAYDLQTQGQCPLKEYTEPDLIDLEMGIQWLAQHLPKQNILVACRVGLGRSPSVIIAYLCCVQHLSFTEAHELVTQKRPGTTVLPRLASLIEQLNTPALTR